MRKIWNKGHRIRASDKHLVYHFSKMRAAPLPPVPMPLPVLPPPAHLLSPMLLPFTVSAILLKVTVSKLRL